MQISLFKKYFIKYCEENKFEKNTDQLEIVDKLINFINNKKNFLNFFVKTKQKLCFYVYGDVGVGKTMILDNFYNFLSIPKKKLHFNEFMINFHDYRHKNNNESIHFFVKEIKKNYELIYLDELQVTNIVDAMILGKLFETIFKENIKILVTSNTKIDDLYKDGLQREQFLPFISILKKNSISSQLIINQDYRKSATNKLQKIFYPLSEKNTFKINQLFRELTKNKKVKKIKLLVKGRTIIVPDFYEGIVKFDFKDLCDVNYGAEDYIKISEICELAVILNVPNFNDTNVNQQQRFITLIDIFYEKKISLLMSMDSNIINLGSSKKLAQPFKRTLSRLFELTSS